MRVLFHCNNEFTFLCHSVALKLKEKHGAKDTDFSGLVIQDHDHEFLKSNKDINYTNLLRVSDFLNPQEIDKVKVDMEYLTKKEKEYGMPNLMRIVYADRVLTAPNRMHEYSTEECIKFQQLALQNIEKLVETAKPEMILFDAAGSVPSITLYRIAQEKGIKTIFLNSARIRDRIIFSYDVFEAFKSNGDFQKGNVTEKNREEARKFIDEFRKQHSVPESVRIGEAAADSSFSILRQASAIPRIFDYFYNYNFGPYSRSYELRGRTLTKAISEKFSQNLKRNTLRLIKFDEPDFSEDFIFFPLHFEPEISTMVQAPMFTDQSALIENIAKNLPINCKLYVKDHPVMAKLYGRPNGYYKRLMAMPGVKVLHPFLGSREIINKTKAVATITGTAGWEAALLRKPVVTFGRIFYNGLSSVRKCSDPSNIYSILVNAIENLPKDDTELVDFVGSIIQNSFRVPLYEIYGSGGGAKHLPIEEMRKHPGIDLLTEKLVEDVEGKKEN